MIYARLTNKEEYIELSPTGEQKLFFDESCQEIAKFGFFVYESSKAYIKIDMYFDFLTQFPGAKKFIEMSSELEYRIQVMLTRKRLDLIKNIDKKIYTFIHFNKRDILLSNIPESKEVFILEAIGNYTEVRSAADLLKDHFSRYIVIYNPQKMMKIKRFKNFIKKESGRIIFIMNSKLELFPDLALVLGKQLRPHLNSSHYRTLYFTGNKNCYFKNYQNFKDECAFHLLECDDIKKAVLRKKT